MNNILKNRGKLREGVYVIKYQYQADLLIHLLLRDIQDLLIPACGSCRPCA